MTTFIFPGQGSQLKGMGADLFSEYYDYVESANDILGYSVKELCLEAPEEKLSLTKFTQPALYVVNALAYLKKIQGNKVKPDFVMGHSLGEYNALFSSGVFDFETGLRLVQMRGELMSAVTEGGMAAIVGLSHETVESLLENNNIKTVDIANYNTNLQVVISGPKDDVSKAEDIFINAGALLYMPLRVSGAFHSRYMQHAQDMFEAHIDKYKFNEPSIPVISNIDAKPYQKNNIKEKLTKQLTHPVLWKQSVEYLLENGETVFNEIGSSKILTGMIDKIKRGE